MKLMVSTLMAVTLLAGFDRGTDTEMGSGAATAVVPAVTQATSSNAAATLQEALTDPEIAAIVVTANSVDSTVAELALAKSNNARIEEFARRMIADHSALNAASVDLVTKLGVTPQPNAISNKLEQGGEQTLATLEGLDGAEFDRAYIEHEIAYHQAVLDVIKDTLIPNARNPKLSALLKQAAPAIAAHLKLAREIGESLGSS